MLSSHYEALINKHLSKLAQNPNSENLRILAWDYVWAIKSLSYDGNFSVDEFIDLIACIDTLNYHEPYFDSNLLNSVISILRNNNNRLSSDTLDIIFESVFHIIDTSNYTQMRSIMNALSFYNHSWRSFLDFCDWWGLEHFRDDDYIVDTHYSFAERIFMAYSRQLCNFSICDSHYIFYINFIQQAIRHKFSFYANFHIANFLTSINFSKPEVLRLLRPFIKQKHTKPWSWLAVADVFDDGDIRKDASFLYALHHSDNFRKEIKLSVYIYAVKYFSRCSKFDLAHYFLDLIVGLGPSDDLGVLKYLKSDWYVNSSPGFNLGDCDFKSICHDIFVGVDDADLDLWNHILSECSSRFGVIV